MGTLAGLTISQGVLPLFASIVAILLILQLKGKIPQIWFTVSFYLTNLVYLSASLILTGEFGLSSIDESLGTYAYLVFMLLSLVALWKLREAYLSTQEKIVKNRTGLLLLSLVVLFLGAGISLLTEIIPSLIVVTFWNFNPYEISIILSTIILSLPTKRDQSPEFLPLALLEVLRNMKDAVFILDPEFRIVHTNVTAREIFPGILIGEEITKYLNQIVSKLDKTNEISEIPEFERNIKGLIYKGRTEPIIFQDKRFGWSIILTDITKHKHAEEALAHNALHDRLTELPNRIILMDRLNHALLSARRDEEYKYAILCLDLDRFNEFNKNLGHQAGDQVLIEVAKRLEQCLRKVDTAARIGGDEFVILLDKISGIRAASEVAVRVLDLLSQKIIIDDAEIYPSASIGISIGSSRHRKPDDILREADIALQQAKEHGRGQFVIFDREMHAHVSTLFQLETDLHQALEEDQLELHYQPVVTLPRKGILGFEALLRWNHPVHGTMLPGEFLPEADEPGLILPIGYWGIRQACQDLSRWADEYPFEPPLSLSVNLFRRQLLDPELPEILKSILHETNIHPSSLALEIKEEVIVDDDQQVLDALKTLRTIGVKLTIDDFGSGLSSLRVLPTYPIDSIKIAPTFIHNISRSSEDYEVARFIVELGHKLGLRVIAKGIESPHELVEIQSVNCTQGQGSYFSKPLISDDVCKLLSELSQKPTLDQKIDPKKIL